MAIVMMEICSAHECIPDIALLLFTFRYVQVVFDTCPVEPQSELPCEGFSIFACYLSLRLNTQVIIKLKLLIGQACACICYKTS